MEEIFKSRGLSNLVFVMGQRMIGIELWKGVRFHKRHFLPLEPNIAPSAIALFNIGTN